MNLTAPCAEFDETNPIAVSPETALVERKNEETNPIRCNSMTQNGFNGRAPISFGEFDTRHRHIGGNRECRVSRSLDFLETPTYEAYKTIKQTQFCGRARVKC